MFTLAFLFKILSFFFTSVVYTLVEYFYSILKNDNTYKQDEIRRSVYNGLALVVTETTSVVIFLFLTTKLYTFIWGSIPHTTPVQVMVTVIIIDILYYFYHRAHHNYPALYTIHRIHHVGTKYNLSLALMLPWIGQASIYIMLVPLIFLHISPQGIMTAYFFVLTYQLFVHISYVNVPLWCDIFFITPRNHRTHHLHDRNSQMHNFGAIFSFWDRIFSTYMHDHHKKDIYGIDGITQKSFWLLQKETATQFFQK